MLAVLSTLLAFSLSPSSINLGPVHPGSSSEIQVRYLGANGWAVTVGQKILIFDYQERTDPDPPSPAQRDLAHGYIDPEELSGLEVYVFVTHSHFDHFDPVIYQWANALDRIHYVFGWKAGDRPTHHYVEERRAQVKIGDVEI